MTRSPVTPDWLPVIPDGAEPLHARLRQALAGDIAAGRLAPGDRLPTHRDLAFRLSIGIGTVTRAYAEAETLGLVASHVGRGSFVAQPRLAMPQRGGLVDLAHNLAPSGPSAARIKSAFAAISRRGDLAAHFDYAPPAGLEAHRRAGAAWIAQTSGHEADPERLLVTAGAQQAMSLVFGSLCLRGDTVLTESATYFGMRTLAERLGLRLEGVAMDSEGLVPEALDEAAAKTGARTVYMLPTLQNPTGRTAGPARRAALARVARARDLWIVEDDVYAPYADLVAAPVTALAPERSFFISGASKAFGPGLRTGYVVAPDAAGFDKLIAQVRALHYAPPTLGSLVVTQWIEDGTAVAMLAEAQAEIAARWEMAVAIFGARVDPHAQSGPHIWLPMPESAAERLAARAQRQDIEVTPPAAPIVAPDLISGVRLCLGAVAERPALERALRQVADAAEAGDARSLAGIV